MTSKGVVMPPCVQPVLESEAGFRAYRLLMPGIGGGPYAPPESFGELFETEISLH